MVSQNLEFDDVYDIIAFRIILDTIPQCYAAMGAIHSHTMWKPIYYKIKDYKTRTRPFEGHYLHYDTKTEASKISLRFSEGDIVIPTDQPGIRYIIETMEPTAMDSFFNWNFFDTILQQKEGFSPYVFEDQALEMLEKDPALQEYFELEKSTDSVFASSWYAQLDWLFKKSKSYESAHMQYPVYRVLKK